MRITKKIILGYIIGILSILVVFNLCKTGPFMEQIEYCECIVNSVDVVFSIIIFYNIRKQFKSFILFPLSMFFLLLVDVVYLFFRHYKIEIEFVEFLIDFLWFFFTILWLSILLHRFVYKVKESYIFLISLLLITSAMIFFFTNNFVKFLHYPFYSYYLAATIVSFYLCILLIISTKNKYLLLAISGLCIVEISDCFLTECYLAGTQNRLVYSEFCFFLGVCIISTSLLNIIRLKLYNPDTWFFNSNTIRNRFSFIIFSISIWSFIIACTIIKQFINVNENELIFIPAIGMFYSMVIAIISITVSKIVERPFKLIQATIRSLFDKNYTDTKKKFHLIEFQKLNDYIIESYEGKAALEKHIISMATRIAHDIKSPLQIIENLIKNNDGRNNISQEQLLKQIQKINYISKSLLTENKKLIGSHVSGIQSLYTIAIDLISDKQIEWNTDGSIIDLEYRPNEIIWLSPEQSNIKHTISNLLNNAFEANQDNKGRIKLVIDNKDDNILIQVNDNGCGIDETIIDDVLNGKSLKINGNGIGLSTALKFMNSVNGTLNINSEMGKGTSVTLKLPQLKFPAQFISKIQINTKNIIVVDDNSEIINFWQNYFLFRGTKHDIKYFVNYYSLRDFLNQQSNTLDVTFLLDYNISGEKSTVVNIIKEYNLEHAYLITNYAEDIILQDEISSLNLKLVPKSILELKDKVIEVSQLN